MKETNAFQKLMISTINAMVAAVLFSPLLFIEISVLTKKFLFMTIFFVINAIPIFTRDMRCIGMRAIGARYNQRLPKMNMLTYTIAYTASFSTLMIWVFFPFDLFIANILLLQLPMIRYTGTTLHGYVAGGIRTVLP